MGSEHTSRPVGRCQCARVIMSSGLVDETAAEGAGVGAGDAPRLS